jgi:hypothetical protein
LAGEVTKPGSFSFKTLSVLKDIPTDAAQAFVRLLAFRVTPGAIPRWEQFVATYDDAADLKYPRFLTFEELGLINFSARSALSADIYRCGGLVFHIEGRTEPVQVHTLTKAGAELASVANAGQTNRSALQIGDCLFAQHGKLKMALQSGSEFRNWEQGVVIYDDETDAPRFA